MLLGTRVTALGALEPPVLAWVKLAVAVRGWSTVTRQLLPEQAPVQPANVPLPAGVAVNVTRLPAAKFAAQLPDASPLVTVQLIPAGLELMLPLPVPEP